MTRLSPIADQTHTQQAPDSGISGRRDSVFHVYILGNETNGKLAVSMTQDIQTRVNDQRNDRHPRDFTSRHALHTLVHIETFTDICEALNRYNVLASMNGDSLSWLLEGSNPDWTDLFEQLSDEGLKLRLQPR